MRLLGLRLKNYRRYRDARVEFADGIMGIVGRNGAGKSTLVEAIGWCLYGAQASRSAQGEIVTTGAARGSTCSVTLEAEVDGETVKIVRELKAGQPAGTARLYAQGGGEAVVTGAREVTDYMSSRLRMDHVAFFRSIFAKQKELTSLSDLAPNQRHKIISRLLRIDTVDTAIQMIKGDKKSLHDRISGLREGAADMREIEGEIEDLEDGLRAKRSEHGAAKRAAAEAENLLGKAKRRLERQEKTRDAHNRHAASLEAARSMRESKASDRDKARDELGELEKDRAALESLRPDIAEYAKTKAKVARLDRDAARDAERRAAEASIDDARASLDSHKNEIAGWKSRIEEIAAALPDTDEIDAKLEDLEGRLAAARDEKTTALSKADDLRKRAADKKRTALRLKKLREGGTCPTCNRLLGGDFAEIVQNLDGEISELEGEADARKGEADGAGSAAAALQSEIDKAEVDAREADDAKGESGRLQSLVAESEKRASELRAGIDRHKRTLAKFSRLTYSEEEHKRLQERRDILEETRKKAARLEGRTSAIPAISSTIRKLDRDIASQEAAIGRASRALESSGFDENAYTEAKTRHDDLDGRHRAARDAMIAMRGDVKAAESDLKRAKKTMADEEKRAKKLARLEGEAEMLARLEKIVADFKSDLASRIRPSLAARTSDLMRRMTGGRYSAVELDGDYDMRIESDGGMFKTGRFSGGEQDLASLCLRIAISQELSDRAGLAGPCFIVLDEVFGSQDGERRSAILGALSELSQEFRQIILITHIEDVKDALPYALHVQEGRDGASTITIEGKPAGGALQ